MLGGLKLAHANFMTKQFGPPKSHESIIGFPTTPFSDTPEFMIPWPNIFKSTIVQQWENSRMFQHSTVSVLMKHQYIISTYLKYSHDTTIHLVHPVPIPAAKAAPSTTLPKTTCLPSKWGVGTVQMKNWLPFLRDRSNGTLLNQLVWPTSYVCVYVYIYIYTYIHTLYNNNNYYLYIYYKYRVHIHVCIYIFKCIIWLYMRRSPSKNVWKTTPFQGSCWVQHWPWITLQAQCAWA